jgi:hypothetical protein
VIYIDSSVTLGHLLLEPRSPPASLWNGPLISSQLLEYEVWNRMHAYGLGRSHADEVQALLIRVDLIEMTAVVLARAMELASYDDRLLVAAQALGIPIAAL